MPAADRDHRVDGLEPGLEGLVDGLSGHDAGGLELQGAASLGLDLAQAVDGPAQRVNDATQVGVAHWHREDLAGAAHDLALVDAVEGPQDDDADLALLKVHGQARGAVLEGEQLVGHDAGQALDVRDAVSGEDDVPDLLGRDLGGLVGLGELVQGRADLLGPDGQLCHLVSLLVAFWGPAALGVSDDGAGWGGEVVGRRAISGLARQASAQLGDGAAHGAVHDVVPRRDADSADDRGVNLAVEVDLGA